MNGLTRTPALAPFRVRSFRFQWPADLMTSWALEMETIILGWYVLVETQSVVALTIFASLLYLGTLLSPIFGAIGDHIGQRALLCIMRSVFATCALVLMSCSFLGVLTPTIVLGTTFVVGLLRPSEVGLRAALLASIIPPNQLVGAVGIQRSTQDSARVIGSLSGASLVALLGMGPAYVAVLLFYLTSIGLMLKAGGLRRRSDLPEEAAADQASRIAAPGSAVRPFVVLKEGFVHVWQTPALRATVLYAFLINLTAFPLSNSLLPVVAKDIYHADQTTLGYMVAAFASGALTGSIVLSRFAHMVPAARMMVGFGISWFLMLLIFSQTVSPSAGIPMLVLAGLSQTLGLVPSTAMLLRNAESRLRGRVMGIRALMVYGNLPGLLLSGPLIAAFGYPAIAATYCLIGIAGTLLITFVWRDVLWRADAIANRR